MLGRWEEQTSSPVEKQAQAELWATSEASIAKYLESRGLAERSQLSDARERLWLPLARITQTCWKDPSHPLILGILGGQGTGKTTLAGILQILLQAQGLRTVTLSIDDFYNTFCDRKLLFEQDPRFCWRGPPGTHDVGLAVETLQQLKAGADKVELPRFDKSAFDGAGDRTDPEICGPIDVAILEGWFVGTQPIERSALQTPREFLETPEDRTFAQVCNDNLRAYQSIWQLLDRLIILNPEDFRLSKQWRQEAEQKMIAQGKTGMCDREISEFVEYFWRSLHPELFITPLTKPGSAADLVVEIIRDRKLGQIYQP
ncbi:MAG: glycerate kinase [Cyanobacteria bacterium P01_H01_bin.15]